MSRTLELNCLVQGDDSRRVFQLEIASTKTVSALKDPIKDKKKPAFDHVPADTLVLWKVSIPPTVPLITIQEFLVFLRMSRCSR
jgi:hypothetical protein